MNGIEYENIQLTETLKKTFFQITVLNAEGEKYIVKMTDSGAIISSTPVADEVEENDDQNDWE